MTTVEVDVFAEFKAALGKVSDVLTKQQKQLQRLARKTQQPVYYPLTDSVVIDANGVGTLFSRFQSGPDQGHFWHVRSIVIGGVTPTTVVTGRADVYATAIDQPPPPSSNYITTMGLNSWRDFAPTLPSVAFYGIGELSLFPQDELLVIVSNATVGQTIVGNVLAWDYEQGALGEEWAI